MSFTKSFMGLLIVLTVISLVYSQEKENEKFKDIIKLKGTTTLVGKITAIDEKTVTFNLKGGGTLIINFEDIDPSCAYAIKSSKAKSPQDHIKLGDFAFLNKLFIPALREYNKALNLDPSLVETIKKKISDVEEAEAKSLLEEGYLLIKQDNLDESVKKFSLLVEKYPASQEAKEAEEELKKLVAVIKDRNQRRLKELEEAKKRLLETKVKELEKKAKESFERAIKSIEDAKKLNKEGLLRDAKNDTKKAISSFNDAESLLLTAKDDLEKVLVFIKDNKITADLVTAVQDRMKEADKYLVITYTNLAHLYAGSGNLTRAKEYVTKALAIDPTDKNASDLRVQITAALMQLQIPRDR